MAIHHMARSLQHDYKTQLAFAYMGQFEMVLHDRLMDGGSSGKDEGEWTEEEKVWLIRRAAEHLDTAIAA